MARTTLKPRSVTSAISCHYSGSSGELHVLQRLEARRAKRIANATRPPKSVSETILPKSVTRAPPWRPVRNPNATLLGLPAELRLQIYAHLSDTKLIHVHSPQANTYRWTPCKGTHPAHPLLCLNPKWSGLCSENECCSFRDAVPPEPLGFWGLAATAKSVREETEGFFMKDSVFSLHPSDIMGWLGWLEQHATKQLSSITKVTLAGPDHREHAPSYATLQALKKMLPSLVGVGYQCQTPRYSPVATGRGFIGLGLRWSRWAPVESLDIFAPTVTVVVEGTVWLKEERITHAASNTQTRIKERQGIVRVIRNGKKEGYEGSGWENDDVRLEVVQPRELASATNRRRAEWKQWWDAVELKDFATKSQA